MSKLQFEVINREAINYSTRQRKEFRDRELRDLADSIADLGLIHAPVVDQKYNLIAGERRIRAIQILEERNISSYHYAGVVVEPHEIPVIVWPDASDEDLFAIELEENLRRVNLSPMEEAQAIAKLHEMRGGGTGAQTYKQTASEVATMQGREPTSHDETKVAEAILVNHFKDDPEIQAAAKQSLRKAAKMARKKLELGFNQALQELGEEDEEPTDFGKNKVIEGDLFQVLPELESDSFDVLLFDPPYGSGANNFNEQAFALGHQYDDSEEQARQITTEIAREGIRLLKPDGHVLMFCSFDLWREWAQVFMNNSYWVWPRPFIWAKGQQAHAPVPGYGPRYSYECILFAGVGKRAVVKTINDVIAVPAVKDKIHAAEKPTELLEVLLDFVCNPGDRVLDPCCGSGSIFAAGRGRELYITGIEMNPEYAGLSKERARL